MGFDINGFKNAFFSEMRRASNKESIDGQINTELEIKEAKGIQSAFKANLANMTEPIGDKFMSNKAEGEFDNVSLADLVALLDEPELNIERVNQLIEEKPVKTLTSLNRVGEVEQPQEMLEMAKISDANTESVQFYTDNAIASGRDVEVVKNTEISEEGIDALQSPLMFDAFMEALYAA